MARLAGKTVLVTGAGQGNGAAIAAGVAREGARVIVADISADRANASANAISEIGMLARAVKLDVTDAGAAGALAKELGATGWTVDILVNNAGICPRVPIDSAEFEKAWDDTLGVNLNGMIRVTRAFLPHLRQQRGVIVNIASIAAFVAVRSTLAYTASKAAVRGLTQALAQELAPDGIRVNAIAPGQIMTPMLAPSMADPERRRQIESRILRGSVGESHELVGPVVFLASDMSTFVNATTLAVDGGFLAV